MFLPPVAGGCLFAIVFRRGQSTGFSFIELGYDQQSFAGTFQSSDVWHFT
jgi:hypothetical protein